MKTSVDVVRRCVALLSSILELGPDGMKRLSEGSHIVSGAPDVNSDEVRLCVERGLLYVSRWGDDPVARIPLGKLESVNNIVAMYVASLSRADAHAIAVWEGEA